MTIEVELGLVLGEDDVILDGGPSEVGVESTIVDCTGDRATLGVWRGATEREALAGAYQILAAAQAAIAVRL